MHGTGRVILAATDGSWHCNVCRTIGLLNLAETLSPCWMVAVNVGLKKTSGICGWQTIQPDRQTGYHRGMLQLPPKRIDDEAALAARMDLR